MRKNKRALITGIFGQDGSYLAEFLLKKGYEVFGFANNIPLSKEKYIKTICSRTHILRGDLKNHESIKTALEKSRPDEIYNLAGVSDLARAFKNPKETDSVNNKAVGYLIGAAFKINPHVKIFQASSSQMFKADWHAITEKSHFLARNPYAKAKILAFKNFVLGGRKKYRGFICSGFLFNHESPRRDMRFVSKKIISALYAISKTGEGILELGNLNTKRDWGYAGDYVEAMWLMLQNKNPEDFIIASGELHSVKDFVNYAAEILGIKIKWVGSGKKEVALDADGRIMVRINPKFYRKEDAVFKADISKIKSVLGWEPKTDFRDLIRMMIRSERAS